MKKEDSVMGILLGVMSIMQIFTLVFVYNVFSSIKDLNNREVDKNVVLMSQIKSLDYKLDKFINSDKEKIEYVRYRMKKSEDETKYWQQIADSLSNQ